MHAGNSHSQGGQSQTSLWMAGEPLTGYFLS